ncbi:M23 family metallopeptidase [Phenylobacterium sp.]|uniref:M23 family metallopeptidase n=1 Tax=Phenylobacterium sp. TaxID=1871053 RepID=UPI00273244A1|nr:M23 family metallopeptidase [Phenylobacterium sp.]MDP3659949.1 M23 family metallopeptidase [Phenylobacterium sp.]
MRIAVFAVLLALGACGDAGDSTAAPKAAPPHAAPPAREGPELSFPLGCIIGAGCEVQQYPDHDPGPDYRDYAGGRQSYDGHGGTDIRIADMAAQRAGVAVLAAAAGRVMRLRDGVPDVSIRAADATTTTGRECGNGVVIDHGNGWETQYCHLAQGSLTVRPGESVVAGQPIARVGLSGNTEFAHLELDVRHAGVSVDPFAPVSGGPLWSDKARATMAYKPGAVLNAGFAAQPVTLQQVEDGSVAPPTADSPALIAYVRAIGLKAGDEIEIALKSPDGGVLALDRSKPLDRDKAQQLVFVGKRRPAAGWPTGAYRGEYRVYRAGKVALTRNFDIRI